MRRHTGQPAVPAQIIRAFIKKQNTAAYIRAAVFCFKLAFHIENMPTSLYRLNRRETCNSGTRNGR
ncbi:hypothetical protein AT574_11480 [Phaeobacter inhibens]|nr:hypothetical protein AT574_11480 [Phaeobacter inhibens]